MKIVIAGGSGFLGNALLARLVGNGSDIVVLTRTARARHGRVEYVLWNPDGASGPWAHVVQSADAIVNLAGEPIAAKRWTASQKKKIRDSRILATRSLTTAIRGAAAPPKVFVNASAVGFYGNRGDETLTEASAPGRDFLAEVCQEWETAASDIAHITRVALIRTGIVLDRAGGALPRMIVPFQLFAGGPVGTGRQYMPWIHKDDWTALVSWVIETESVRGPVNATAPRPVTNAEFSHVLGRVLHRPSVMPAPAFALRLLLGELADALLLSGQRALPVRATDRGFAFRFSDVDNALAEIFKPH